MEAFLIYNIMENEIEPKTLILESSIGSLELNYTNKVNIFLCDENSKNSAYHNVDPELIYNLLDEYFSKHEPITKFTFDKTS